MSAKRYRRLGIIMLIHAVVFSVLAVRRDTHLAFPVMFVILMAVFFRKAREASPTKDVR